MKSKVQDEYFYGDRVPRDLDEYISDVAESFEVAERRLEHAAREGYALAFQDATADLQDNRRRWDFIREIESNPGTPIRYW